MKLKLIISFICFLFCSAIYSQLVNIESLRMYDSDRFVLENNLNLSFSNDNGSSLFSIGNSLGTQFKNKKLNKIYLVLANYRLTRVEGQDVRNKWFVHFRFNYKIDSLFKSHKVIRVESFAQSQYNELLDVNSRNLVGVGVRLKLISNEKEEGPFKWSDDTYSYEKEKKTGIIRLYLGYAYMYEEEKSDAFDKRFSGHRNSSYLSFNFVSGNQLIKIINTIYYQPLYKDFSDYRISEELQIKVQISKNLSLNTNFSYYFDSITPQNRTEYSSYLGIGLGLNL